MACCLLYRGDVVPKENYPLDFLLHFMFYGKMSDICCLTKENRRGAMNIGQSFLHFQFAGVADIANFILDCCL
jgi:hypothetical protein